MHRSFIIDALIVIVLLGALCWISNSMTVPPVITRVH